MSKKSGNFFEEHIEKIVAVLIGLVCLWLLITRVVISPNVVSYDNNKFSSGEIDIYISRQAEELKDKLDSKPKPKEEVYKPRLDSPIGPAEPVRADIAGELQNGFVGLVDSAISGIDVSFCLPVPPHISREISDNRKYRVPRIGNVNDVEVEHIRAAAYVPVEKIDEDNPYSQDSSEPGDIDFVTVEAKFDVAGLIENFYESFAGEDVQDQWRDPCLARPIFAAVQLQRQELGADGIWSDWQVVPRTKIDQRRDMFEVIEGVNKLPPGGVKVRLLQFDNAQVQIDLLQPQVYQIASAEQEWFPPSLHKKYVEYQRDVGAQERRAAREAQREQYEREREESRAERERERSERYNRTPTTRATSAGRTGGGPGGAGGPGTLTGRGPGTLAGRGPGTSASGGPGTPARRTTTRRTRRGDRRSEEEPEEKIDVPGPISVGDFYDEFEEILITEKTNIAKMREPLIFWAHDDTVEPGRNYRYKIRLGVFNPIAGTNQFIEQYKEFKNKVILWSEFSDVTEPMEVPEKLYFFPTEIQETGRTVTVKVSRYVLGYWYGHKFNVKQGEVIGKVVRHEPAETKEGLATEEGPAITVPETIDYATGAVLVDVIAMNDWSGGKNLRARGYFDMLYSFDGTNIKHLPIKTRYWTKDLQVKFNELVKLEKEPRKPLRDWVSGQRRRLPGPGGPGGPGGLRGFRGPGTIR